MKLVIFNGSPRKKRGNTSLLLESFIAGYMQNTENSFELYYIPTMTDASKIQETFLSADYVLLAFPLYTDAMHGRVKRFIEFLKPISTNSCKENPKLFFLVQSGFPEAFHSRYVEHYLQKLAQRLNCEYLGTIIRGGITAFHGLVPGWIEKRIIRVFKNGMRKIGKKFGETGKLDKTMLKKFAFPERLPRIAIIMYHLYAFIGIKYVGFDRVLKENDAFKDRDATPYLPPETDVS